MKKLLIRCGIIVVLSMAIYAAQALVPVEEQDLYGNKQLQGGIIRFHVVANSDQTRDQELKLAVRDAVLEYLHPKLSEVRDQEAAVQSIESDLEEIEKVAVGTLRAEGCSDGVEAHLGTFNFPARAYGPVTFPQGRYQALRIVLGEGKGRNWWCCLFPPLCYVDLANSAEELKEKKEQKPQDDNRKKISLPDDAEDDEPRLTTKIGEWLDESKDNPLLSWIWGERS